MDTSEPTLNYTEPSWSSIPPPLYTLDIIKQSVLLSTTPPLTTSKLVAGRLPSCDIILDHESTSRHHAILQYGNNAWFVYDLNSTHGTFVNKKRVGERKYEKVRVGDTIKFGASSRMYVLNGPEEGVLGDIKPKTGAVGSSSLGSMTDKPTGNPSKKRDFKLSWEESDTTQIPRSEIPKTAPYYADPTKSLSTFLSSNDSEKHLMTTQISPSHYTTTLEIHGLRGIFKASGMGSTKTQSEKDACLEACYKLDLMGVLDKSNLGTSEEQSRKRLKEILGDDEDDSYLDLTDTKRTRNSDGEIEQVVETIDSLKLKRISVLNNITLLKQQLTTTRTLFLDTEHNQLKEEEEDELDFYMNQIQDQARKEESDIVEKQVCELEGELKKLEQLIKIVDPKVDFSTFIPKQSAIDVAVDSSTVASTVGRTVAVAVDSSTVASTVGRTVAVAVDSSTVASTVDVSASTVASTVGRMVDSSKSKKNSSSKNEKNQDNQLQFVPSTKTKPMKEPVKEVKKRNPLGPSKEEMKRHRVEDEVVDSVLMDQVDQSSGEMEYLKKTYGY